MDTLDFPPAAESLVNEADVEQKLLWPILTQPYPHGLGIPAEFIFCKASIKKIAIGKGASSKIYYPDYAVSALSFPVLIGEAKTPGEDLNAAAGEARLYATEINALYPRGFNPCGYCFVSNGLKTQLRSWDSDEPICEFSLAEAHPASAAFGKFVDTIKFPKLRDHAAAIASKLKHGRYERPVNLVGGTSARDERMEYNSFGRILSSRFQHLFNPNSWEDRQRIVREAYVPSRRRTRYVDEIDRIIKFSAPPGVAEATLIEDSGKPVEISGRMNVPMAELKNKILLLIGSVGSGKSTFVDYLQEVGLPEDIRTRTAWVRLDLNDAPVSPDEIYPWCRAKLIEGIKGTSPDLDVTNLQGLKTLYRKQIAEFENGIGALFPPDSPEYNTRLADRLEELRKDQAVTIRELEQYLCTNRQRLLVVGLDNCDKRNRDEQLLMFQVAKWIQQEIRCLVILPLRQETYENHRNEPPLDTALKDLIFLIQPPPFQEVLSERLKLVLAEARGGGSREISYHMNMAEVKFPVERLDQMMRRMMEALFSHDHYGRKIILGLAGSNIRRATEIFLDFCRSGYIDEKTVFQAQTTGGTEFISQGVIARVLMRTNRRYYDGDSSYVKNLFQCDPGNELPDHFARYRILAWLRANTSKKGPSGSKGYFPLSTLVGDLILGGADADNVREQARYLLAAGCIISEHLRRDLSDEDLIAITASGHVHLELAHSDFHYLAACAEDCWLSDLCLAETIRRRITMTPFWKAMSWPVTLDSARDFVRYLHGRRNDHMVPAEVFLEDGTGLPPDLDLTGLEAIADAQIRKVQSRTRH